MGTKTSKKDRESVIELLDDSNAVSLAQPYITIDNLIGKTGELLFEKSKIGSDDVINRYNDSLDKWESGMYPKDGWQYIAKRAELKALFRREECGSFRSELKNR